MALGLTGCVNDSLVEEPVKRPSERPSDTATVTFMIPDTQNSFNTKADTSDPTSQEGTINDLYLVVYKKDASGNTFTNVQCEEISSSLTSDNTSSGSKTYSLDLAPGTYKFYLLANCKDYLGSSSLTSTTDESTLRNLILNFSDVINSSKLPMACLAEEIKENSGGSGVENGEVNINSDGKTLYAGLNFLCSKVRYTVLFDNTVGTGISEAFGTNVIDLATTVGLENILSTTPLAQAYSEFTSLGYLTGKTSTLTRFAYPTTDLPSSTAPNLTGTASEYQKTAWQGVAYLPENTNSEKPTTIKLTGAVYDSSYAGEGGKGTNWIKDINKTILLPGGTTGSNNGLARNKFYDVVISVKSANLDLDVTLNVTVNPWGYESIDEEW